MNRTALAFGSLLALGLAFAPAAEARDIQITVPVRIVNLHPTVTVGRVQCHAATGTAFTAGLVGSAVHTDFTLTDGSFSGDVTVSVNVPDIWWSRVHGYRCDLRFARPFEASAHSLALEGGMYFREEFRLLPGSEFRHWISGPI